jgi:anaerobic ribonucleoside-triphosphate reductase activating protein
MANIIRIDSFHSGDFHKCSNNGPGFRIVVWFSGCHHNCPGCHNKEEQNPKAGKLFTEEDINFILTELERPNYRGISILGGEPFEPYNTPAVLDLCKKVKEKFSDNKSIWIWSGSTLEQLKKIDDPNIPGILETADILVDGPFIENQKDLNLRFRGSKNQRIIDLKTGEIEE